MSSPDLCDPSTAPWADDEPTPRHEPDPNRLWVVKDRLEKRNRGPRHLARRFATRTLCGQESAALELCGDRAATCKACLRVVLATDATER